MRFPRPFRVRPHTAGTTTDHAPVNSWRFDEDPFNINQFSHPYLGATMHGIAHSGGLSFWEALVYSNAGSYAWEVAGERGPPGINDMITTSQAGSLLGESLLRMASLILENHGRPPGFWRELGAAALLPPLGLNRLVFGDRFKSVFPSHNPPKFWRLRLGASADANVSDNSATSTVKRQEVIHYGITPQGLVALRLIFGERAMLDLSAREYYIGSHLPSDERRFATDSCTRKSRHEKVARAIRVRLIACAGNTR